MTDHPAAWYPDPTARREQRYYDGQGWTDHVSDRGVIGTDPVNGRTDRLATSMAVGNEGDRNRVREQIRGTGWRSAGILGEVVAGGGSLFEEPILVVNQKAKLIELDNQYCVLDQNGSTVATVEQVAQSTGKKALRLFTKLDHLVTHHLQVLDTSGQLLLQLTRPGGKRGMIVADPSGVEIGRIVRASGKIDFSLEANGVRIGSIMGWTLRDGFWRIDDANGTEVARVTKTFVDVPNFTHADEYVVQLHVKPPQPLHTLIVAAVVSVDKKHDARGFV